MAEKNRSEKLKRLVAVQRHLERMAENELADTTRQRAEVTEAMERVMVAIGSVDPVHMAFSIHYAERYGRLMIRDQQLESIQTLIQMKVQQERTKADRLEEHMKDARELELRESDDNAVYDIIDQRFAGATPASSKVQK
ncbi:MULTISPECIES: hypothetical protein [unclassified Rhizobium]|uniref:hypothetical protein n=1 Tax=Rhizobium TaxID=379 RepID=UPI00084BCA0F|nr:MULTISPECIES: hypothetical protein [unclassified Rhizobium]MCZ3375608.1 hypothetical protein [Rhizobium sp. AG207R]MDK4704248.1 hypothetical protein [Rhizobium sp. CNPSo 4062]OED00434.1 hypothetical protein A9Z06_16675 [Rhizobium sp. YK2]QYA12835.1 hypothetical protein J5284_00865 [Rhizobium sp. AB2/73]TWB16054.1 hypothetical protein FBZ99_103426 [Rhizobium sp. ERR1071]